jgi:stage IV sporulation protein FB
MTNSTWSVSLGCWGGVQVRLHVTLVLVLVCALLLCESIGTYWRASFAFDRVVLIMLLGLISVAAHAASHIVTAARRGWETREVILAPWGEWSGLALPDKGEAAISLHLVGIVTNVFICAMAAILLWLHGDTSISEMLVPLDSRLLLQNSHQLIVIRWLFCMNYCLVLMNLIPAAPFDGERILSSLLRRSRPKLSPEEIHNCVQVTGRIVGLLLIAVAIGLGQGDIRGLFPAWFPLTVLGVIALFAAETPLPPAKFVAPKPKPLLEDELAEEPADDADGVSSEVVEWEEGPFAQWLEEKRELERARRQEAKLNEVADERRVDEILARLHDRGHQSLSAEDREVLQRVSDRLRRRKQKKM